MPSKKQLKTIRAKEAKMNIVEELKKEHEEIERELIELDEIINSETINYPNLVHTFTRLHEIWNAHERKEEVLFLFIEELTNVEIPVERMMFEHEELREHKNALKDSINSGNNEKVQNALQENGKILILKLRNHINFEDEFLYRIDLPELDVDKERELAEALTNLKL